MLSQGQYRRQRLLTASSVARMTTDHLTAEQRKAAVAFLDENRGWGFGVSIITQRDGVTVVPGRFGWDGGLGTSGYADPRAQMVGILMTQRLFDAPDAPPILRDFWTSV